MSSRRLKNRVDHHVRWRRMRTIMDRKISGGYIYFIQAGLHGPIKIGITANVSKRHSALQQSHYEELHILKTIKGTDAQEQLIHMHLFDHYLRGEWFKPDEHVLNYISDVRDFLGQDDPILSIEKNSYGTLNHRAKKLTPEAVMHIRTSKSTEVELSKSFGVSRSMIGSIRRQERWDHPIWNRRKKRMKST